MSKWFKFELFPKKQTQPLPSKPCVYAVYFDEQLVYIGQTNRLSNRFSGRRFRYSYANEIITPWCEVSGDTRITIKARFSERYGDWAMWEIRLINRIKPLFNTHHKIRRGAA